MAPIKLMEILSWLVQLRQLHPLKRQRNMKRIIPIMFAALLFLTTACVDETEYADNARGNFEALWRAIDEHYCFFDYKREQYGLDWEHVLGVGRGAQLVVARGLSVERERHFALEVSRHRLPHRRRAALPRARRQYGICALHDVRIRVRRGQPRQRDALFGAVQRTHHRPARQRRRTAHGG